MPRLHLTIAALVLAGCGPKIQQFDVTPRRICAGTPVSITFKVRGEPHMTVARRGDHGSDTTTYTIVARGRSDSAYSRMEVITFASAQTLVFSTGMLGIDSLIAADTLSSEAWGGMTIDQVTADSARGMVVIHAGKTATLKAGTGAQSDWHGQPVAGRWELHAGLLHGEVPGNPAHHPPAHLYLTVGLACGTGEAHS
ncbi:MAG: hypothetical protein ABJC74_05010 [Gemmatimonadota bacterium]